MTGCPAKVLKRENSLSATEPEVRYTRRHTAKMVCLFRPGAA